MVSMDSVVISGGARFLGHSGVLPTGSGLKRFLGVEHGDWSSGQCQS